MTVTNAIKIIFLVGIWWNTLLLIYLMGKLIAAVVANHVPV